MQKWSQIDGNPHIHRQCKSGKIVHKMKNVEKWKTPLSIKTRYKCCGKLKNPYFHIQNKGELFYNSWHKLR